MRTVATLSGLLCALPALALGCVAEAPVEVEEADGDLEKIHHGSRVGVCGWPTTVSTGGCTGALIHERAISTAQHCPTPSRVTFGESRNGSRSVRVVRCVGEGSSDAQICELAESVSEVPVTPVLFGCELGEYLQRNRNVVVAGFGRREDGRSGRKDWANQTITRVTNSSVIVGPRRGERASLCNGDSGGPAFVQVDDGSWRVIGTVRGNWSGPSCQEETEFKRTDPVVRNFERRTGIDITPCFDSRTGAWEPGPTCGGFFAGDHRGSGRWSNWCSGTPTSGYSAQCGAPFSDGGGNGSGDDGGDDGGDCHDGAPDSRSYCSRACPCEQDEGDCDGDAQCAGNLVCREMGSVDRCVSPDSDGDSGQASLRMSSAKYDVDQQLVVSFDNVPPGEANWIGIYPAGAPHEEIESPNWAWISGDARGTVRFEGRSRTGTYEARLFYDDSYDLEASVSFTVERPAQDQCRNVSRDRDCRRWASQGWCERDSAGMERYCCAACEARN